MRQHGGMINTIWFHRVAVGRDAAKQQFRIAFPTLPRGATMDDRYAVGASSTFIVIPANAGIHPNYPFAISLSQLAI